MSEEELVRFSACIRVRGAPNRHDELSAQLGVQPTECHRAGETASEQSGRVWQNDIWLVVAPVSPEAPLSRHLSWVTGLLRQHREYFQSLLAAGILIDVYCTFRTNSRSTGFEISSEGLDVIAELALPIGVSVLLV